MLDIANWTNCAECKCLFEPAETRLADRTRRLSVESLPSLFHRSASLLFLLDFFSSFQSFPSLLSPTFSSLAPPFPQELVHLLKLCRDLRRELPRPFLRKKESRIVMNPAVILYGVFRGMLIDCFTLLCEVYFSPQF